MRLDDGDNELHGVLKNRVRFKLPIVSPVTLKTKARFAQLEPGRCAIVIVTNYSPRSVN